MAIGFGFPQIIILVVYLAIILLAAYGVIRLAVFHAMKSHTRWLQRGQQ